MWVKRLSSLLPWKDQTQTKQKQLTKDIFRELGELGNVSRHAEKGQVGRCQI